MEGALAPHRTGPLRTGHLCMLVWGLVESLLWLLSGNSKGED